MRGSSILRRLLLPAMAAVLSGCTSSIGVQVNPETQAKTAEAGLVSVIARYFWEWEGEQEPVHGFMGAYFARLVDLESGRKIPFLSPFSLEAGTLYQGLDGWVPMLLKPGTYVMAPPRPPNLHPTTEVVPSKPFKFTVPADARAVYIGSWRLRCRGRLAFLFNDYPADCTAGYSVVDERDVTARISKLPMERFQTVLARPYGRTVALGAGRAPEGPLQVTLRDNAAYPPPRWADFDQRTDNGVDGTSAPFVHGAEVGVLLAPVILAVGAVQSVETSRTKTKWSPCVAGLYDALRTQHFEPVFREQMRALLEPQVAAGATLRANLQRVQLRKCQAAQSYCIEVAVRALLTEAGVDTPLYDATHVYSSETATAPWEWGHGRTHYFWERPVKRRSSCRELSQYCNADGHERAVAEVRTALGAIAAAVAADLGLTRKPPN